jgi:hypothetical protein
MCANDRGGRPPGRLTGPRIGGARPGPRPRQDRRRSQDSSSHRCRPRRRAADPSLDLAGKDRLKSAPGAPQAGATPGRHRGTRCTPRRTSSTSSPPASSAALAISAPAGWPQGRRTGREAPRSGRRAAQRSRSPGRYSP